MAFPFSPLDSGPLYAQSSIVNPGTKFVDGLAAPPLCCPDRAGILTGQYPHDSGVFSNSPGYPSLTDQADTLPVWLRRGGYRTGFIGKFLNNSLAALGDSKAPGPRSRRTFQPSRWNR